MPIPQIVARVCFKPHRETDRYLPESPRLVHVFGRDAIAWVNVQTDSAGTKGHIHLGFLDNGERRRYSLPARPGFVLPTDMPDTLFVGMEKAVGMLNLPRGVWTPFARIPDANPRTIINDGEVLPGGCGVIFGTKDVQFAEQIAKLYLLTLPDQQLVELAEGMTCSNGKVIVPIGDDCLLYDIDTPRRVVERYYFDAARRELMANGIAIDLQNEEALPDGMVSCGDGSAIVAFFNPSRGGDGLARRFRLDTGQPVEEWTLPGSPRVTCPLAFTAKGRLVVIFTTAVEGMSDEIKAASPNAGCLFMAESQVPAQPIAEFVRI